MSRVAALVVILIAITALVIWAAGGSLTWNAETTPAVIGNLLIVVVLLASLVMHWRGSLTDAARHIAIWLALLFALILGYSYRTDFRDAWQRVTGELNPATPIERSGGEIVLRRADDGHFHADVGINGATVRMLVDTGATSIALSAADAARAGIDVDGLSFDGVVSTANGYAPAASVTLKEVRVGSIVRRNIRASVQQNLTDSLLGLSFLDQLSKYSSTADEMVLED
ncbi:MAG: TIGR02281 family clan AA aspartic protease [Alphaproteobacteria bacterium]|nr:TIGR02281 family clan AA aspartic protease [Alphaproteobacteria bacterium]